MTRSLVHLLNVFAVRLEIDHGPKPAVDAIKLFAKDRTIRCAEGRNGEGEKRIERQRTLFAMLPSSNATDRLKAAMLQRSYDLLWDGDTCGCDAILEFVPSRDADKMLECWAHDFEGDEPRSSFYAEGQDA